MNEVIICNNLTKKNIELEQELEKLKKEYNDLEYRYNGLLECKTDIYKKYQQSIISKNSR